MNEFSDGLTEILDIIKKEGVARLLAQGHSATGEGIRTLTVQIDNIYNGFRGSLIGQKYLLAQDTGILASRYKISRQLIDNLIDWITVKNIYTTMGKKAGKPMSLNNKRSLAFAIARTHEVSGMHTAGRRRDTTKQGWLTDTVNENEREIINIIEDAGYRFFDNMIKTMIDEAKRNI